MSKSYNMLPLPFFFPASSIIFLTLVFSVRSCILAILPKAVTCPVWEFQKHCTLYRKSMKESFMFFGITNENKGKRSCSSLPCSFEHMLKMLTVWNAATQYSHNKEQYFLKCSGKPFSVLRAEKSIYQFSSFSTGLEVQYMWPHYSMRNCTGFTGYIHKTEVKVVNPNNIFIFIVTRGTFSFLIAVQSTKAL